MTPWWTPLDLHNLHPVTRDTYPTIARLRAVTRPNRHLLSTRRNPFVKRTAPKPWGGR